MNTVHNAGYVQTQGTTLGPNWQHTHCAQAAGRPSSKNCLAVKQLSSTGGPSATTAVQKWRANAYGVHACPPGSTASAFPAQLSNSNLLNSGQCTLTRQLGTSPRITIPLPAGTLPCSPLGQQPQPVPRMMTTSQGWHLHGAPHPISTHRIPPVAPDSVSVAPTRRHFTVS